MWEYEKRLQFPVRIKNPDARAAKIIISQYGGLYSLQGRSDNGSDRGYGCGTKSKNDL